MTELLLVGAGHAHLYVLRQAETLVAAGYRVRVLAPRFFHYSGVASATAAGVLPRQAGQIDVRALAGDHGVAFQEGTLASLDPQRRVATTGDGMALPYDMLSLNIGSVAAVPPTLCVDAGVLRVKPLSGLADLDDSLRSAQAAMSASASGATVTVVGGGATGLELAAHLALRRDVAAVELMEAGPRVGADLPAGARRRLERLLAQRGVAVRTGCAVSYLGERTAVCDNGTAVAHDVALLATGLVAPPLLSELGLGDANGVPVRATLQLVGRDEVDAVGDSAHFVERPLPRIGVHGVRQGPVLRRSLLARLVGEPLPVYQPQRLALAVLDLGGGVGLAVRGRWWWYGGAALRLKRFIDRRWLTTYRA